MKAFSRIIPALALAAALAMGLAGCATAPQAMAIAKEGTPAKADLPAADSKTAPASQTDEKPVAWDPEVLADFQRDVPRFVRALAKQKMEEMARDDGSFFVDRALYDKAMAEYKR